MIMTLNQLKKEASDLFQSLGLDLSTATGMFYIQALRCHGLPFPVIVDGEPKIFGIFRKCRNCRKIKNFCY